METGEIYPGHGCQGGEPGNEVERVEYDVRGSGPDGQSTSWATLSIRYSQSIRFAHGLGPAHGASFPGTKFSVGIGHCRRVSTTSAFPKPPGGCRRKCP